MGREGSAGAGARRRRDPRPSEGGVLRASRADGFVLLLAAVLLWGAACGSARRSEPFTGTHHIEDPRLALGEQVFARQCSACHPAGEGGLGVPLNNKPYPRWLIRFQVRKGIGPMPSFSGEEIGDDEMDALLDYLVWLRRRSG